MMEFTETETPKMGYENIPHVYESYGKAGWHECDGRRLWTASQAERDFLDELALCIRAGEVARRPDGSYDWLWQPGPYVLKRKWGGAEAADLYKPDAYVNWVKDGPMWYEVKHGRIEQDAGNKAYRFCLQYPDKPLVLVWKGPLPKPPKGKRYKRQGTTWTQWCKLTGVAPHRQVVHHVWRMK